PQGDGRHLFHCPGLLLQEVTMASLHEQRFTEEKPLLRGQDAEMVSPLLLSWSSNCAELEAGPLA
uniref:Uncharacterized protein n=1 Tax=Pseudonaja textilis TaxID=8673 RepID=A0A670YHK2_PSETE